MMSRLLWSHLTNNILRLAVLRHCFFYLVICLNFKSKYLSSAFLMLLTSVIVKIIGAVYKIPLTSFIGAVGRGYFATAYNLCMPIHIVAMGAFPVALSRLVSKYNALGESNMLLATKKSANRILLLVGVIGMSAMLMLAVPYSRYIANAPRSIYTILVLAPSVLFSSLSASYRGYFEGYMNMVPTSISQTFEAVFKLVFGLTFAKYSMVYLYDYFSSLGMSNDEALSLVYPFTSAFAMLGVTLGTFVSLVFLWMYYLINHDKKLTCTRNDKQIAGKELMSFSFPIMISCAVQSFFQFFDTASVQLSLSRVSSSFLCEHYSSALQYASVAHSDVSTYVYGLLSSALDFKNLVPGVTMALGVCAVPAVSGAVEVGDMDKVRTLVNSVYKYTVLISSMGGIALALLSTNVLELFYGSSSYDIVLGCSDLVKYFALTIPVYSLAGTAVFVVQAMGKPEKSILPYVVSGVIRVVLNIVLVSSERLVLFGAVISGFVGYAALCVWNMIIAGVRIDLKAVVIKPFLVFMLTYCSSDLLLKKLSFGYSPAINIILQVSIIVVIYCILCILCGLLNFWQIFCAIKPLKKSQNP